MTSCTRQRESLSADCMLPSSTAALSAGLKKLACELLAKQGSSHVRPQSIGSLLCATSLTGPYSRSSPCLQPSWTLKRPMTACSTLSEGLWASLQRKGVHGKMLAAIQSLYSGDTMGMKICGRAGATGTAQVGVRQGCPLRPTLFGLLFDDLHSQLQSDCPSAGIESRGNRIPSLFYADDVALLSASAQGLQQLLDSTQSFCAANGLTINVPKIEVVVFGAGHHDCAWNFHRVAGQDLKRSQSFTYLGMLFHEDKKIRHAVQARFKLAARLAPLWCPSFLDIQICNMRTRERERNSNRPFSQHWLMRTCPSSSHLPNQEWQ